MKKIVLFLALITSLSACAQNKEKKEGIQFFHGTYEELLKEAKKQNKPVFIDVYTKWCGPCKVMAKATFIKPKVGDFYNKNLISYKIDAEVGEGPELAKKFNVKGFPTLLYLDPQGNLIQTAIGAKSEEQLITLARKALGEEVKDFAWYEAEYKKGNRNPEFMRAYHKARFEEKREQMSFTDAWELYQSFPEKKRWDKENIEMVLWKARVGNNFYEVVKKNKEKFPYLQNVHRQIQWMFTVGRSDGSEMQKKNFEQIFKDFPKHAEQAKELFTTELIRLSTNYKEYIPKIIAYTEKYGEPVDYNLMIMTTVPKIKSVKPEYALYACKYFKQIIDEDPTHFYTMSCYAYCLYIGGKKKEAEAFVKKYKDLTNQYASNKKMKWCYDTMIAIEEGRGDELVPFYIPGFK